MAVSSGPGAYTSLRVGASVAKGICYALEKPLISVNTLLSLADAMHLRDDERAGREVYMPALDARREEIWTALYGSDMQVLAPDQPLILTNNMFYDFIGQYTGTDNLAVPVIGGNGVDKIRKGGYTEKAVFFTKIKCSATHLSRLAEVFFQNADFQDIAYWEPFYMKPPNITTPNNVTF